MGEELLAAAPGTQIASGLVVGLLVLGYVLWRQLRVGRVQSNFILPVILAVLGLVDLSGWAQHHPLSRTSIELLVLSLVVFAIGLGAARAWTVKIWEDHGQLLRQGTWLTLLLWLVAIALHLWVDSANGVGSASILLYLGLALGTQRVVVGWRARQLAARGGIAG